MSGSALVSVSSAAGAAAVQDPPLSGGFDAAADVVAPPSLASAKAAARGAAVHFVCSRFVEFPRLSEVERRFNTCDYSGENLTHKNRNNRAESTLKSLLVAARLKGGKNDGENQRRSRRGMRLSVRGIGESVRLLTLATRDVFHWEDRERFGLALKWFIDNTRHIIGGYVVCAELTKREFCHAHLAIPDKSDGPAGHYTGYTVAELHELRALWRKAIIKFAPAGWRPRPGVGDKVGSIHITGSRGSVGVAGYMSKRTDKGSRKAAAAAAYMGKSDVRNVFFSHRYRSSRGLVRVMAWHPCDIIAAPRADFTAGNCKYYAMTGAGSGGDPFCAAVYDAFGPADLFDPPG